MKLKHESDLFIPQCTQSRLVQIMDILADQPSQLLFGDPPVPRNVEADIYSR